MIHRTKPLLLRCGGIFLRQGQGGHPMECFMTTLRSFKLNSRLACNYSSNYLSSYTRLKVFFNFKGDNNRIGLVKDLFIIQYG